MSEYAGSALRGAFGHALKEIACLSANQHKGQCRCPNHGGCVYQTLFTPQKQESSALNRSYSASSPLIFEAHALPEHIQTGQHAYFDVACIGQYANTQWPIIQLALQKALQTGIGKRHPERGGAQIIAVNTFGFANGSLPQIDNLEIELLSHTRLQREGKILKADQWEASLWLMALLRRYTLMQEAYQLPLPSVDWQAIAPVVPQLIWRDVDLSDVHWVRWSNRQKRTVPLDGVIGRFVLEQVPSVLQPYIHYGQWLHVGKNSMFGLGQYQIV